MEDNSENKINIIVLGESGVGKTSLINVYFGNDFTFCTESTMVSYCLEGEMKLDKKSYTYHIWDTPGQEKYRALNKIFMKGSQIILIVYSIVSRESFNEVDFWINFAKENIGNDKYIMALVANKIDLYENQIVNDEEGKNIAKKYDIEFTNSSALQNPNDFINFVNRLIINYIEKYDPSGNKKEKIKINKESKGKKKCC